MDSDRDRDLETANLQALIGLWQQEERRLRSLITDQPTAPEVSSQAEERLSLVLNEIQLALNELATIERAD
jgi:type II secretory pathway component PulC